jgi:hypothetical protein
MALRYLDLDKPNYIPTYQPLNPEMLSQVATSIQQQGATAQQYRRSQLDAASQAYINGISNLSPEDQEFARSRFAQTQNKLSDIVKNVGARGMMPYVDEEVSSLTNDLAYHKKASNIKAEALEIIDESSAPLAIRNYVLRNGIGINYDEETGKAIGVKGGFSQNELSVARNWEDFSDYLNKFSTKREGNSEELTFGQNAYSETMPNGYVINYRKQLSGIGFDEAHLQNMRALLSDPKMREQLSLYANAISADNPDIRVTEGGKIERDFYVKQIDKTTGKYLTPEGELTEDAGKAKVVKETKEFASKEAMAASMIAEPYSMRDSGLKTKYLTTKSINREGGNGSSLGNDPLFTTAQSVEVPEMDSTKYLSGLYDQKQQIVDREKEILDSLYDFGGEIFGTRGQPVNDFQVNTVNGKIQISYNEDESSTQRTTLNGVDEITEFFTNRQEALPENSPERLRIGQNKNSVLQKVGATQEILNRRRVLSEQLYDAQTYTYNELDKRFNDDMLSLVQFNPNGTIRINDQQLLNKIKENPDKYERGKLPEGAIFANSDDMSVGETRVIQGSDLRVDETKDINSYGVFAKISSIMSKEGRYSDILIRKTTNGFEYYGSDSMIKNVLSQAKDIQQKMVDDLRDAGEFKEYIGVKLIPGLEEHEYVIGAIEQNKGLTDEGSSMDFVKPDGEDLTDDEQEAIRKSTFRPHSIVLMDGEPKIIGSFISKPDEITVEGLERVFAGGEEAISMAQYLYGEKYQLGLGVASINSLLPELMSGNSSIELTPAMQRSVTGGYDSGQTLRIEHKVTRNRYGENSRFVIRDSNGGFVEDAPDAYTIQGILLSLVTE